MDFLSHEVKKDDVKRGDHIYTWRAGFTYSHHGIYVGDNKVIHFTADGIWILCSSSSSSFIPSNCVRIPKCGLRRPNKGVIVSCLDCFLGKGSLHLFKYESNSFSLIVKRGGTCTTAKSDPVETVIYRAVYLLNKGFGRYHALLNNCEDFALYCKTGLINRRGDGLSSQVLSLVGAPGAAVLCSPFLICMSTAVVAPVSAVVYCRARYKGDIGVRTDLVKVPVEDLDKLANCKKSI